MSGRPVAIPPELAEMLGIRPHEGYVGVFTRGEYPGAIPNGTPIVKQNSEPGDTHADGAGGRVLGSIGHPSIGVAYFIEWNDKPKRVILAVANKVRRA